MQPDTESSQDRDWHAAAVARVLAGDVRMYAELVARHRDRLFRHAFRMLSDADEAEDVTQETFVRAYRSLHTCEDPARFGGWIFTILANRCRTAGAKRARRETVFVSADRAQGEWNGAQCGSAAEPAGYGGNGRVDAALSGINAAHREAFLLKYVEEMSYEEMAVLTGARVSALKMRVSRAREALRARLTEKNDDD